jgi:predicted histone-like DNA-binding protein
MSQKVQVYKNTNPNSLVNGKYFVRAVYDDKCIDTDKLADYIQSQCTVKRSDCKAVLDELGSAFKHFFELGQKIKLDNIGIFKVGVSSSPSATKEGCTAANVKNSRVIFAPQTEAIATGETATIHRAKLVDGVPTAIDYQLRTYNHPITMLKDVQFEIAKDSQGSGINP